LDGAEIGGRELTAVTKGGETFPVIVHSVAAWRGEEIVGVRAVIVDISEQKRAREALETAEEIVSAIPTGILIYRFEEPDRLVLVAGNETAATFVDAERSAGEELKTHWPARMVERLRPSLVEVVRDGGIYDREAVVGPPEARRAFHMRAFRIPGNRIVLAFEEITERVRAEEALKAEEEKYRLLFENMMNGFALHEIVLDEAGTPVDYVFLEVNAAFERMVGLRREELVGERVTEVIPGIEADTADWIGRYGKVALTGEETRFEQYAELLGRWYSVLAFSPRPGQFATIFEDVTEERLAAERIEESERRYRAIVELAPVGIVTVNLDGTVASCNEEFAQIAGYESDEMVGRHFSKLPPVRARDIPRYVRIFAAILRGRRPEPFEATWTMKDGTVRHGEVHVALLRREDRTWGIQVIVQDITHRKEAEDELRASEAKFRDLVEELHEALFTVDEHGIVTYVSPSIERITGYAPSELIGKPYSAITLEEDVRTVEEMREILARAPEPRGEDYRVVAKDGTVRWTRMSPRPIFEGDRFAGIRGLVIDVTEEKLAGEALKVSERRYQSLFENAALGIYQTTPDGRILAANPSLVRMLGYDSFEDLATRNLEQNGYESETPRERFKERIEREGRIEGMESVWVRKDGERLFVRENAVAVRDDEGSVVFYEGTVEDITAQRRAEAERRAMEAQLRQSQKLESIGTLASGVAHEINNPITGIINYAHLVHDRTSDVSLKRFAEGIAREGERVAEIVRNLLSFSRHEKESHSPARICDIVEQTLSLVTAVLRKDQIHVDVDVPADLPDIRCRSQQIQQVLMNLLTNARDALNARYPKLDEDKIVRIVARSVSESGKEWIRLTVEDHGAGIPEEIVERIFDPFFTTKPRDKGTGLGLSISHGIIRDHGGSLSIESKPGVYTRFIVKLPIDNGWRLTDEETSE